jgi:hypothetical protein
MIIANLMDSFIVFGGDSQNGRKKMRFCFGKPGNPQTIKTLSRDYWKVRMILSLKSKVLKYDLARKFEE